MKVLFPSIACIGRIAYPERAEVTKHDMPGRKGSRLLCGKTRSGRSDLGDEQTQRLEHKEMSATSKTNTAGKSHSRIKTGSRPIVSWGRPLTSGKKQVGALDGTVGVGDQASGERFAEIESGRTRWQQGLVATCRDSRTEVKNRRKGEPEGFGA